MAEKGNIDFDDILDNIFAERKENGESILEGNLYPVSNGEIIKHIRISLGLSQRDVAKKLGISQNGYSKIERGYALMTIDKLKQIATALNFDYVQLLNTIEQRSNPNRKQGENISVNKKALIDLKDFYTLRQKRHDEEVAYLKKTIESQSETILLLKEKIASLEKGNNIS